MKLSSTMAYDLVGFGGPICWGWAANVVAGHFMPEDDARLVGVLVGLGTLFSIVAVGTIIGRTVGQVIAANERLAKLKREDPLIDEMLD